MKKILFNWLFKKEYEEIKQKINMIIDAHNVLCDKVCDSEWDIKIIKNYEIKKDTKK